MGRKKKADSLSNYFNESVEEAIQLYNISKTQDERDRLFRKIYPALSKIAQVFYNKIKPTYMEGEPMDIQMDCIAYLTERLDKIQTGKGKGFSYMTVCARNYYIQNNVTAYSKVGKVINVSELPETFDMVDIVTDRVEQMEESAELLHAFADYLDTHKQHFSSALARKSMHVIAAVIELIRNVDNLQDFNRRNIMNGLTDINGLKVDRHYITKLFNRLEIHYLKFKPYWLAHKTQMPFLEKNRLTKEEIEYCIENYKPSNKLYGIATFAKKFGVEEYAVRKELYAVGLCSSI
jgi:hypothetical protein